MTASFLPIWLVDVIGSVLMIVFSVLCVRIARRLKRGDPDNIVWTYLVWVCTALTVFSVSRSAGHIVKQMLLLTGNTGAWRSLSPFSGAVNTFTFILVGGITLFFERTWNINQDIRRDRQRLEETHAELIDLNQHLESRIAARTEELALSERNYRRIFEVSRDMIVVTSMDGRILTINPAGRAMLGIHDGEGASPIGNTFSDFFADPASWEAIVAAIDGSGYVSNLEIDLNDADGRQIRSLVSGSLDRGSSDRDSSIHFLAKDIEQRLQVEEQIAQADKLASIGQLSAGIAHEINNPLGIILGYTQLLLRQSDEDSETYQDLKTIEKQVRNCKTVVEDLLNFARTSPPSEDAIQIADAIDDVLSFVRQHAGLEQIEVIRDYDAAVPEMLLDEKKIKQVFMNLIMNARHAIGDSGRLSIATDYSRSDDTVRIMVSDDGYGIEKTNLSKIFDPFFTTKSTGEGTGLGLSVSYGIVKNHGGDIRVESTAGRGSTFTVVLPVIRPATDTESGSHGKIAVDR